MDLLYRKVSQLTNRKRKMQSLCVHDKEGNVLTDSDKVKDRWKEYIEDLCDKNNKSQQEDMHLERDTGDVSEFEVALGVFTWKGRRIGWDTSRTVKSTRCKRQKGAI